VTFLVGEPSVGNDWITNATMYQGSVDTFRVTFDNAKPPNAIWTDATATSESQASLDGRLITDHTGGSRGTDDRTIVAQLAGEQSIQAYTDDDGATPNPPDWITSSGGGFPSGVDHQSIGAGPYHDINGTPFPANPVYPHPVYYCSQALEGAFCARSDDGGVTYGAGVPVYTTQCGGLHGKPKMGPDGTVYLPNKDCSAAGGANAAKGVIISKDNGVTWTVVNIPNTSTDSNQSDPDLAIGGSTGTGTLYYGYRDGDHRAKVAVSTDEGATWSNPIDVGAAFGVQNAQFPAMVAGDQNRAAFSFIGTSTSGNDLTDAFPGVWYLYVSFTYDGGKTWQTVNATPNDPVQRGGVCMSGVGCSGRDRNMLDFNDDTIDRYGRVFVAYADGCSAACETDPNTTSGKFSSLFSLVRQVCGMGLFAADDPGFSDAPGCTPSTSTPESPIGALLLVVGGLATGVTGLITRRRRRAVEPTG
jgi:hypothetical protein